MTNRKKYVIIVLVNIILGGTIMKRILSAILLCAVLIGSIFTLWSCGGPLSGKYEGDVFDLKFSGDNVTVLVEGLSATVSGTYEIKEKEDGSKTITFDFIDDELAQEGSIIMNLIDVITEPDLPFEEDGDTIKIGKFIVWGFTKH